MRQCAGCDALSTNPTCDIDVKEAGRGQSEFQTFRKETSICFCVAGSKRPLSRTDIAQFFEALRPDELFMFVE